MKTTKDGKALYLHCLPADITGVSCETGEVDASVFDRYRIPLYKEASFKPYIIAAMIMLSKFENHFAIRTVRFQVQLEADGYFSAQKISCLHPPQAGRVGTNSQFFESDFR